MVLGPRMIWFMMEIVVLLVVFECCELRKELACVDVSNLYLEPM